MFEGSADTGETGETRAALLKERYIPTHQPIDPETQPDKKKLIEDTFLAAKDLALSTRAEELRGASQLPYWMDRFAQGAVAYVLAVRAVGGTATLEEVLVQYERDFVTIYQSVLNVGGTHAKALEIAIQRLMAFGYTREQAEDEVDNEVEKVKKKKSKQTTPKPQPAPAAPKPKKRKRGSPPPNPPAPKPKPNSTPPETPAKPKPVEPPKPGEPKPEPAKPGEPPKPEPSKPVEPAKPEPTPEPTKPESPAPTPVPEPTPNDYKKRSDGSDFELVDGVWPLEEKKFAGEKKRAHQELLMIIKGERDAASWAELIKRFETFNTRRRELIRDGVLAAPDIDQSQAIADAAGKQLRIVLMSAPCTRAHLLGFSRAERAARFAKILLSHSIVQKGTTLDVAVGNEIHKQVQGLLAVPSTLREAEARVAQLDEMADQLQNGEWYDYHYEMIEYFTHDPLNDKALKLVRRYSEILNTDGYTKAKAEKKIRALCAKLEKWNLLSPEQTQGLVDRF